MISVIRNRRKGHVYAPGSKAYKEREHQKLKDAELRDAIDNDPRRHGDNGYHTGRIYPLIDDKEDL